MFVYRVSQSSEIETAFSGVGSKHFGGRWNSKGAACIYMVETLSLAILQFLKS
ncbi:MAG: RES family NAD+ phosphorylase [Flavobacteriales bacterium]|nr:RES family NAD+ phosphorylase [Flavobacteriales bacterium]